MENLGEFIVNHWILSSLFVVLLFLVFSDSLTRKLGGFNAVDVPTAVNLVNQQKAVLSISAIKMHLKLHI